MKAQHVFIFLLALVVCSCNQPEKGLDQLQKQVQDLESNNENLQKELKTEKLKTTIKSSFLLSSPLEDFFEDADNWDVIDVSREACLRA